MIFDILFLAAVGIGFWWGYQKGIIYSIFSVIAYFIGVFIALKFSYLATSMLKDMLHLEGKILSVVAFSFVFILTILIIRFTAWGLEQILKSLSLNLINQLVGGLLHSFIAIYVLCVFIWFVNKWNVIPENQKRDSHTYGYINDFAPKVVEYTGKVLPMVKDVFYKYETLLKTTQPAGAAE